MNNSKLSRALRSVKVFTTKHSPEILTGIGIAGMISTTVLAVKATPKALKDIEEFEKTTGEEIKPIDAIKVTWKNYIPAAVTGTVSIACLIGASSVNMKRNAALATAYKLSETALTEYREKVVETIGEKKERAVHDKIAEKRIKENPVNNSEVIMTGNGDTLCYDPMSGRYFKSSIEKIKAAENKLNKEMLHQISGYVSLNEFYDELNLSHTDVGDIIGWNTDNLIDIDISAQLTDDRKPCIALIYFNKPDYGYDN